MMSGTAPRVCGGRGSVIDSVSRSRVRNALGTNSTRQPISMFWLNQPPRAYMSVPATPVDALQTPMAAALRVVGTVASSIASEAGTISAAPSPCAARAASSRLHRGVITVQNAAMENRDNPMVSSRRGPNTSASRPPTGSSAAYGRAKAVSSHWVSIGDLGPKPLSASCGTPRVAASVSAMVMPMMPAHTMTGR